MPYAKMRSTNGLFLSPSAPVPHRLDRPFGIGLALHRQIFTHMITKVDMVRSTIFIAGLVVLNHVFVS